MAGNRYWPRELAGLPGAVPHERYVVFLPLALSQTKDDKGRVRWTFFGSSEQGPDRAFWKSFYRAPGREHPPEYAADFIRRLLHAAYGETPERLADLRRAGFRILPGSGEEVCQLWRQDQLPAWTKPFLLGRPRADRGGEIPADLPPVRLVAAGGAKSILGRVAASVALSRQPDLLGLSALSQVAARVAPGDADSAANVCDRHEMPQGVRIPQSGWLHEPHPGLPEPDLHKGKLRNTYRRTSRWARVARHENELSVAGREDSLAHVLFSAEPDDVGLYGKPMARNSQIWTYDYELLLDGPRAGRRELSRAAGDAAAGGQFGYRFYFPPMQAGQYDVFWQRPVTAFWDAKAKEAARAARRPRRLFHRLSQRQARSGPSGRALAAVPASRRIPALAEGYRHAYTTTITSSRSTPTSCWRSASFSAASRCRPISPGRFCTSPRSRRCCEWLDAAAKWGGQRRIRLAVASDTLRRIIAPVGDPSIAAAARADHLPPHRHPRRSKSPTGKRSRNCRPGDSSTRTTPTAFTTRPPSRCASTPIATWKRSATICSTTIAR